MQVIIKNKRRDGFLALTRPPKRYPQVVLDLGMKKGGDMVKKGYTPEQIINKLREAEILLSQGSSIVEASRKIGITEQTYYRWRKEYGGMRIEQARKLKDLEKENARLKKLVADLSLDNSILKEAARGNF
jgi:putative transposase